MNLIKDELEEIDQKCLPITRDLAVTVFERIERIIDECL
jgi:hypothetical protein